ncbi:hypothetical protein QI034_07590 [Staphylococcus saprophyticus]|nr:hypothetical protein [Staphylococcus saprophyticus]
MHLDDITQKLKSIEDYAQSMIEKNVELQAYNKQLRELAIAQQDKLNSIHESAAKAQYEAELWQKRYEAAEQYIKDRLEITPASIPYDNVRMVLNAIKKHDLHELD